MLRFRRASSVEDLVGGGFSTLTSKWQQGLVQGNGIWDKGHWKVVVKRALQRREPESAIFRPGPLQTVAFAVWNGGVGERGGQKAVAPWVQLVLDPASAQVIK